MINIPEHELKEPGKISIWVSFAVGLAGGFLSYHVALSVRGLEIVDRQVLQQHRRQLAELQEENRELTEELFGPRVLTDWAFEHGDLPYAVNVDAKEEVSAARKQAIAEHKFLMVTFGANWCMDCRNLHRQLHSDEVAAYTEGLFEFVNVDVGKFNQNRHVANELGVSLSRGIPVAIFFNPDGQIIGTTNDGQLEPARRYTSKQILKFVRDIAEHTRILAPDAVH